MVEVAANDSKKPTHKRRLFIFGLRTKGWDRRVRQCVGRIVRAGGW